MHSVLWSAGWAVPLTVQDLNTGGNTHKKHWQNPPSHSSALPAFVALAAAVATLMSAAGGVGMGYGVSVRQSAGGVGMGYGVPVRQSAAFRVARNAHQHYAT